MHGACKCKDCLYCVEQNILLWNCRNRLCPPNAVYHVTKCRCSSMPQQDAPVFTS